MHARFEFLAEPGTLPHVIATEEAAARLVRQDAVVLCAAAAQHACAVHAVLDAAICRRPAYRAVLSNSTFWVRNGG
jgi:hypothetical protein